MAPEQDVDFLVEELKKYLPEAGKAKILSTFTGIRPLVSSGSVASTSKIARSHRIFISDSGLVTITGGKWTTARLMAEQTVSAAVQVGGLSDTQSRSANLRLQGACDTAIDSVTTATSIVDPDSLYGSELAGIEELEARIPELTAPWNEDLPYRLSHAVYAVRKEMALTLEDVMARRTRAFFLNVDAATNSATKVAGAISRYGNVDEEWATRELAHIPEIASKFRAFR
jgi:glycerol-3-phosphate dehydrogenase